MKIVSAARMREIDRMTAENGLCSSLELMENAGRAVAQIALGWRPPRHAVVICGGGDNGGDGFVAARHLHEAAVCVELFLLADPSRLSGAAATMFERLPFAANIVREESQLARLRESLRETDLIVDALLGSGFHSPLRPLFAAAIEIVNQATAPVLSIDLPSGVEADATRPCAELHARSSGVVAFTAPKPAHLFAIAAPTRMAAIGSPESMIESDGSLESCDARAVEPFLRPRPLESNKGDYGHVLLIGGSLGRAGAVAMSGMAALRAGSGLVTVATAASVQPQAAAFAPELMTEPLAESSEATISEEALEGQSLQRILKGKSVVAIGPGLSRNASSARFVRRFLAEAPAPTLLLDADALNAFEADREALSGAGRTLILTPHPGEMARLTGLSVADIQAERIAVARRFAVERRCILALKGHRTLTALPDGRVLVNTTGNPGMATAGSGDILTGMIAAFVAQTPQNPGEAVAAAVYLHGLAGDCAAQKLGERSLIATDLLRYLPEAMEKARELAAERFPRIG